MGYKIVYITGAICMSLMTFITFIIIFFWYIPAKNTFTQTSCQILSCSSSCHSKRNTYSEVPVEHGRGSTCNIDMKLHNSKLNITNSDDVKSSAACQDMDNPITCWYDNTDAHPLLRLTDPNYDINVGVFTTMGVINTMLILLWVVIIRSCKDQCC